ncbi:acetylcholine receptor subunit alpha-type acr-16 [Pogonomyrmex barbatus]|uniref:Acetylcholine receptor subunit alpha-type acr-16 n=1 Tax=Pogonomyrmex barbatus TaxID=144034 RepID=A0A8N1S881_9HYME|nr:acetylcholine receptor subunit alpha-type acr-16 [Pogonomyrmex barbatus]
MAHQARGLPQLRIKFYNTVAASLQIVLLLTVLPQESLCGRHEKRLLNHLLANYNNLERPVANESEPLEVKFGITLQQIIDVDEKNQILTTNAWLKLEWTDYNLQWNQSEYGGVKDLRITPNKLWKPDILMYNSADEGFDGTFQTNVVVTHNGSCLYVPPGIFKSTCKIDITWFPFDDQHCDMKFGSWTYDGNQLDLILNSEEGGDLSDFITNGEWYLIGEFHKASLRLVRSIGPRVLTSVYVCACICACACVRKEMCLQEAKNRISNRLASMNTAMLIAEVKSAGADRFKHGTIIWTCSGVTILLSLTVFLNLVAESMPTTSDAVPLIGSYFNCIMFMVASSVVLTVLVLNYHHRSPDRYVMPNWVKKLFLQWLPYILCMSRPGKKITKKTILMSNRMKELELQERSSKSLLANVLDIDDDFRHGNSAANPASGYISRSAYGTPLSTRPATVEETSASLPLSGMQKELHTILKELQFITSRMKKADEDDEVISDWKFAAMVVDRLCLIIFTLFTILATVVILCRAPHIIVQ